MQRINEQFCVVSNPFNRNQVSRVSLKPEDVEAMVFWTKNPSPLIPYLDRLDQMGYRYYFQYTVNGYGELLEPRVPPLADCLAAFRELAGRIGPEKVIWRYDPIVISNKSDIGYHKNRFSYILDCLHSSTRRVMISFVDDYRKAAVNFKRLAQSGLAIRQIRDVAEVADLVKYIAKCCEAKHIEVYSCAETFDLSGFGVKAGKCIDAELIGKLFNIKVSASKDKSQRKECGCVSAKDIGHYDTCLHGCLYCYAGTLNSGQMSRKKYCQSAASIVDP
jgi:hypothetical protein